MKLELGPCTSISGIPNTLEMDLSPSRCLPFNLTRAPIHTNVELRTACYKRWNQKQGDEIALNHELPKNIK
jgi:hypothetical protein